jgi:drug/metabolite transporter (DMT)-like permease
LIIYTNPVFVAVLAYFMLNEKVGKFDFLAIVLVLGGCYIVISGSNEEEENSQKFYGYLFSILSCLGMGFGCLFIRKTNTVLNSQVFTFYTFLVLLIFSLGSIQFTDSLKFNEYGLLEIFLILGSTVGGIAGQTMMGLAYKYGEASYLSIFWNLETVICCVMEATFMSYHFKSTDFIGGSIVLGSLIFSILIKQKR